MTGRAHEIYLHMREFLRYVFYLPYDAATYLTGRHKELVPPRRLMFIGSGDFKAIGEEFLNYFIDLGKLERDHAVLDVGCGIGRMAVPLTRYLTSGTYEGFDIVDKGVSWCQKKITSKHTNFQFHLADVYSRFYNPSGGHNASEYIFPFADKSFDFVIAISVFTHMLPPDVTNYFSEVVRVLKSGGRAFITCFLMNDDSSRLVDGGLSFFKFKSTPSGYWTVSQEDPESALAFSESSIRKMYDGSRMKILDPIHFGSWSGRQQYLSFQDIIVAEKE